MNPHQRPPCRCKRLAFPHRKEWRCDEWLPDASEFHDPPDDSERLLDERDRAQYINDLNRGFAK